MAKARDVIVTVDELIATLNHSSLPTLVVEGGDDLIVFRRLEDRSQNLKLSVLPVKGRERVLALFDRKDEIKNPKVMFAADRDLWVMMSTLPVQYRSRDLLVTKGYSIENDAYEDAEAESLLSSTERGELLSELQIFVRWYALAVSRHLSNPTIGYKNHPNEILDDPSHRSELMELAPGEVYPEELYSRILKNYVELLRGKSLVSLFVRQMKPGRPVRHNGKALLEIAAARPGPNISRLFDAAEAYLA